MGERLDKLKRMARATSVDEEPICKTLAAYGFKPQRTSGVGGKKNRELGDIWFPAPTMSNLTRVISLEVQVVSPEKRHTNFSYGGSKVRLYRGYGKNSYENGETFSLLGCYEDYDSSSMIYVVVNAKLLHDVLSQSKDDPGIKHMQSEGDFDGYYVIRPESLVSLLGESLTIGDSLDEVVEQWCQQFISSDYSAVHVPPIKVKYGE